jgi:uncharacterized NAD(P)/FAD-binding protein YdhS
MPGEFISRKTIAIIGGGFSGTAVGANLLRQEAGPLRRVCLIKRKPPFGARRRVRHKIA